MAVAKRERPSQRVSAFLSGWDGPPSGALGTVALLKPSALLLAFVGTVKTRVKKTDIPEKFPKEGRGQGEGVRPIARQGFFPPWLL